MNCSIGLQPASGNLNAKMESFQSILSKLKIQLNNSRLTIIVILHPRESGESGGSRRGGLKTDN